MPERQEEVGAGVDGDLVMRLAPAFEGYSCTAADRAITAYKKGCSTRMAARQSGVAEAVIERWIDRLQIRRSRDETRELQRAALDAARVERTRTR